MEGIGFMKMEDLTGRRYGKWLVLVFAGKRNGRIAWKCVCDCGSEKEILGQSLRDGSSKSCGVCPPANIYLNNGDGTFVMFCDTGDLVLILYEDVIKVKPYQWSIGRHGYVTSGAGKEQILMHRLIMNAQDGQFIDHINHHTLDNRRDNLRICSQQENNFNRPLSQANTTGYKGVCYLKTTGKYQAQIQHNRKAVYLGLFESPIEAALAYDVKALELFGDFACLNFQKKVIL
jgi:hypothetical protein